MGSVDVSITFVVHPLAIATLLAALGVYLGYAVVKFVLSLLTGG